MSPEAHILETQFGAPQKCPDCGAIYRPGTVHPCKDLEQGTCSICGMYNHPETGVCNCADKVLISKPAPQVGGTHYSSKAIQPIEYINANQLNYHQGNIVKYITRYKDKNGVEDLRKALWYIEDLIKLEEQS